MILYIDILHDIPTCHVTFPRVLSMNT
jgi:hypothetical protein